MKRMKCELCGKVRVCKRATLYDNIDDAEEGKNGKHKRVCTECLEAIPEP